MSLFLRARNSRNPAQRSSRFTATLVAALLVSGVAVTTGALSASAADDSTDPNTVVVDPSATPSDTPTDAPSAVDPSATPTDDPAPSDDPTTDPAPDSSALPSSSLPDTSETDPTDPYDSGYGDGGGNGGGYPTDECVANPVFSYTWDGPTGTGVVTVSGGADGQPLCTALYVRAVSYTYDSPVGTKTPSYGQTLVGDSNGAGTYNDYTVKAIGQYPFETPGATCGEDYVYATFAETGFDTLEVSPTLSAAGLPFEPSYLSDVVTTGEGGNTYFADNAYECGGGGGEGGNSALTIVKTASTKVTEAGKKFSYTLAVSNTGDAAAAPVVVTDTVPAGLVLDGVATASGWTIESSTNSSTGLVTLTFTRDSLAAGTDAPLITIPVKVAATATGSTIVNTATACADDEAAEDCVSDTTTVNLKSVVITTEGGCSGTVPVVTYDIHLTNVDLIAHPTVTFEWLNANGDVIRTDTVPAAETMHGTHVWPGVVLDADGNVIDWPGWSLVNGHWVEDSTDLGADLRPTAVLHVSAAPYSYFTVDYPTDSVCSDPSELPTEALPDGEVEGTLASTGTNSAVPFWSALALLVAGIGFVGTGIARRARRVTD
jgi:uncharacterized repeat protein (TIGR01451 family)